MDDWRDPTEPTPLEALRINRPKPRQRAVDPEPKCRNPNIQLTSAEWIQGFKRWIKSNTSED